MLLAPSMISKYRVICDVGPEYLKESKIKMLTQDEIDIMINEGAAQRGY